MNDLISRKALIKYFNENSNDVNGNEWFVLNIIEAITNAPAIEQGEPVLTVGEYMPLKMADILRAMPHGTKLYTSPQSLQAHDDEVIERVIEVLKTYRGSSGLELIEAIRALKGK